MHWDGQWWRYLEGNGNAGVLGIEAGSMWAGLCFDPASVVPTFTAQSYWPQDGWWVPKP